MPASRLPLSSGERILWEGAPPTGLKLQPLDALLIPFSLLWGGFAVFWNVSVWTMGADWFFRLWGLPFLLVGLYMIAGRFFVDAWIRRRTRYVVTDRRILIERRGSGAVLHTLDLRRLPMLATRERPDGSGTILFGERQSVFGWTGRTSLSASLGLWHPSMEPTPQFLNIPHVAGVRELIERAARA